MKGLVPCFSAVVIFFHFNFSCLFKCTVLVHNSVIFILYYILYQSICASTWIYLDAEFALLAPTEPLEQWKTGAAGFQKGTKKPNQ